MEKVTMTVKELAKIMGISLPSAYDLTEVEGFPLIRVGSRKLIPIDAFHQWLNKTATKEN